MARSEQHRGCRGLRSSAEGRRTGHLQRSYGLSAFHLSRADPLSLVRTHFLLRRAILGEPSAARGKKRTVSLLPDPPSAACDPLRPFPRSHGAPPGLLPLHCLVPHPSPILFHWSIFADTRVRPSIAYMILGELSLVLQ
ncbi:hypothetical protein NDU88_007317 [Pleurodeles waltl]|uniref:Uncharacterized protein n=1 Tax=Pleurodeles waltl TaxID=8319 RepID=A0AAV7VS98_PLEWA|nr:hypothetical protein NDU88_007317 [Pleurodeles waltl]